MEKELKRKEKDDRRSQKIKSKEGVCCKENTCTDDEVLNTWPEKYKAYMEWIQVSRILMDVPWDR